MSMAYFTTIVTLLFDETDIFYIIGIVYSCPTRWLQYFCRIQNI